NRLSEAELVPTCMLLLIAGHETTVNLIGNGLLALLQHPDQFHAFRDDPAFIQTGIEELLRFDGPVQRTGRMTTVEVEIGGKRIPKHSVGVSVIGAPHPDPTQFPHPPPLART